MLVLSRQEDQGVLIGECVRAVLIKLHPRFVDLRVEAPPSFQVEYHANGQIMPAWTTFAIGINDRITIFEPPVPPVEFSLTHEGTCKSPANPRPWMPGESVDIVVVQIGGERARLGIAMPKWMPVQREEIH